MCAGFSSLLFGYSTFLLIYLILPHCFGQDITLTPQNPATVREGQTLVLTCQSNHTSGLYQFFYINSEGNTILYASGGGGFQSCSNNTNGAFIECDFGTPWNFNLILLNPAHNQTVYCQRSGGRQDIKNSSTTIFVQVPVSNVLLSPSSSVEVIEGTSFTFSCLSNAARPAANITWYNDGVVVNGSSSSTSMNNLLYDVTSNLTSSFQRTNDGMRIYCTAVNINGDTPILSTQPQVNVIYAPPAAPQLTADGSTSVDEGQSIYLRCNLSTLGNPNITWSWVCGDDTLTTGVTNTGTWSVLTLTANRKYNQRTCQCRATSPRPSLSYNRTSGTQTITVYYTPPAAPQLTTDGSTSVDEGQSITLRCTLSTLGNPIVTWSWLCGYDTLTTGMTNTGTQSVLTLTANRKYNQRTCQCRATSPRPSLSYNRTSGTQTITVYYAPPAAPQLTADGSTSVDEGQSIYLRCTLSTLGNPNITWSWVCGDDTLTTGVTNTGNQSVLTLTANRKYNQRTCQCRATSPSLSLSYNRTSGTQTITVYYAPPAAPQLTADGSTSVDEGQSIYLRCNLSTLGNPNITWSWVCGDDTLTTGVTNSGTWSVLTLTANRKYNQRTCQCRATSPRPSLSYNRTSGTQTITVYYTPPAAPQLTTDGSTSVDEGQSITLRCTLSTLGNPHVTWSWLCGYDTLTTGMTNTGTQSVLTLTANRKYNQRTCQCRATSPRPSLSYNRTSGTQTITVYYAPPAAPQLIADGSTSVDEGQSIYLRCNLSTLGNPNITWSWVCEDDTLTTGMTNTGTQSELTLTANRKYNQRTCQCRAASPRSSLSYNRTSGTQTITVYYNNVISSNVSEGYVISEHGRLQIKCDVDGNPLSTITWLFVPNNTVIKNDSDVSSSTLDILSASCLDHGNYKVTADNGKGPVDTTTTHIAVRCKPRLDSVDVQTSDKLGIGNNESLQILVRMLLYPQATLTQWTFVGKNNESRVIQNNTGGYSITESKGENKQNISLYKRSVDTEEFGDYTIMVLNDVGNFTRTYYVDAARPPLKPTNLTLVCVTSSVKLSWISNFNGGGSQTFKISYSTEGNLLTSYKDLENISDKGYGTLHSYTPSIELQGAVWFTITVSNMFGESTSDNVHCIVKGIEEKVNHQTETIVGSVVGSVAFIVAVLVIGIFLRRRYKCTCMLKMGIERIDENVKAADMSKDESQISLAEQHEQGERNVYEELKEREAGNQYQDLSIKGNKESKTRTYENIQGSNAGNEYKENSIVSKKKDEGDQTYYNTRMVTPTDVYVNTSFQN